MEAKMFSPTILLEGGKNNLSYSQKNLSQIIKVATGNTPSNFKVNINPKYNNVNNKKKLSNSKLENK
jgi:hypothetical protein